ncbi:MAG: hypothetical protein WBG92_13795 [Thiohalocapsa sp.]
MSDENANSDYLWNRREDVLYRTELGTLYHRKRERFLAFWDRTITAIAIILGSAAFANLGGPELTKLAAAIIAATATIGLVFGLADSARRHSNLAQQFLDLEARVLRQGERDFTEDHVNQWDAEIREIESAEPAARGALVVACQNEIAGRRSQPESIAPLGWWRRLTKQFFDYRVAKT